MKKPYVKDMPQTLHPVSSLCTLLPTHNYSRCTPLVNTHPHPVAPAFSFFASPPLREARVVSPPRRRGVTLAGQRAVPALVRSRPAASVVGRLAIGPVGVEALFRLGLGLGLGLGSGLGLGLGLGSGSGLGLGLGFG